MKNENEKTKTKTNRVRHNLVWFCVFAPHVSYYVIQKEKKGKRKEKKSISHTYTQALTKRFKWIVPKKNGET